MIELGVQFAIIIAIALPIITTCMVIVLEPSLRMSQPEGLRKYLSYLFFAPEIAPLENQNIAQLTPEGKKSHLKNQLLIRLGFIYLFVAIFIISNVLAQFYLVANDLLQPVTQSGTDLVRTWESITIYGPFVGGWKGALPWYESFVLPPPTGATFHETWKWIIFTQGISDNQGFLGEIYSILLITTSLTSMMFFIPLAVKSIRKSLVPSLFFYFTGVLIMTKSLFAFLGQSLRLVIGDTITFGLYTVSSTSGYLPSMLMTGIIISSALIILTLFISIALGRKIWHVHYPDNKLSEKWFLYAVSLMFLLSLVCNVVMI